MPTGTVAAGAERYTGKPRDAALGLYYFGARYYDPGLGRFITADPARDGLNWYAYCDNSPAARVDPDGHQSQTATWAESMSWLMLADGLLPIGDLIYAVSTAAMGIWEYGPALLDKAVAVGDYLLQIGRQAQDKIPSSGQSGSSASPGDPGKDPRWNRSSPKIRPQTVWERKGIRLDVENFNPQQRMGQVHVQVGEQKYIFDPVSKLFFSAKTGALAPNSVQKLLEIDAFREALSKALEKYLGLAPL